MALCPILPKTASAAPSSATMRARMPCLSSARPCRRLRQNDPALAVPASPGCASQRPAGALADQQVPLDDPGLSPGLSADSPLAGHLKALRLAGGGTVRIGAAGWRHPQLSGLPARRLPPRPLGLVFYRSRHPPPLLRRSLHRRPAERPLAGLFRGPDL